VFSCLSGYFAHVGFSMTKCVFNYSDDDKHTVIL